MGAPKEYTQQSVVAVSARKWVPCGLLMSARRMILVPVPLGSHSADIYEPL